MSLVTFYFIFPWYTYTFTLHLKEIIHHSTRRTYYYSELRWMMINLNKVKISFKRHHLSFCEPLWLFFFFLYTLYNSVCTSLFSCNILPLSPSTLSFFFVPQYFHWIPYTFIIFFLFSHLYEKNNKLYSQKRWKIISHCNHS